MADDARIDEPAIDAPPAPEIPEPWWGPGVRLLRWLLGAFTLVGGLTWILVNLTGPNPLLDLVIGVVLATGALVLLMPHRIQLPKLATTVAVVGGGVGGTLAGLLGGTGQTCCAFAYVESKGWPFTWAQRGAEAADPGTAFRLAQTADWHVDLVALSGNLLLWSYLGMLCVVIAVLVRRDRRDPGEARPE
jgi:hypothetical protein